MLTGTLLIMLQPFRMHMPGFIRKKAIRELFRLSADAFRCETPDLDRYSSRGILIEYARFTNEHALKMIAAGDDLDDGQSDGQGDAATRLYQNAYQFGRIMRQRFRVVGRRDVIAASRLMYGILGIDMKADRQGAITISRCFFSRYYSGDVCRLISSLDEGMAAGISGGGKLAFVQRITEGYACCKACLTLQGDDK